MNAEARRVSAALPMSSGDAWARTTKTSEAFARELVADVIAQGLSAGDRLRTEAEMVEHYGYARQSVREGLRLQVRW